MGQWVSSRLYPTRVEVAAGDAIFTRHDRLPDDGHVGYDWQLYAPKEVLLGTSRGFGLHSLTEC